MPRATAPPAHIDGICRARRGPVVDAREWDAWGGDTRGDRQLRRETDWLTDVHREADIAAKMQEVGGVLRGGGAGAGAGGAGAGGGGGGGEGEGGEGGGGRRCSCCCMRRLLYEEVVV